MGDLPRILFVSYGGGHANIAALVYKALAKRGGCALEVLALTVAGNIFERHQIPFKNLCNYVYLFDDKDEILSYGKKWADIFYNPDSHMEYEECVAYLGLGFRDLCHQIGEERASEKFRQQGRKAVCAIDAMKTILRHIRPDAVVLTCGVRMEKAAGLAANALGIPVVRIGDLPVFDPAEYQALTCVMNEYAKKFAQNDLGIPTSRIFVTGSPVFEDDLRIDPEELEQGERKCNRRDFRKMILFLEEPGIESETRQIESCLLDIAKKNTDMLFVFKLHPNQNPCKEEWLSANVLQLQTFPLKPLLYLCDVAVTKNSTAGVEAALVGKPLINILLSPSDCDFSEYGISERVTQFETFEQCLFQCLDVNSDISVRQAKARAKFCNASNAAAHIAAIIVCVAYGHRLSERVWSE